MTEKKVKLDQPARHPAGSGGEEPRRSTQKWPPPLSSRRHGLAWSVAPGVVTVAHKHRVASGVRCGECAPQICKQPPPQAQHPPCTAR